MMAPGQKQKDRNFPRLVLGLALLVVGGFIVYTLYQEHGRIEQRERERLATQAKVIDENLTRQLDGVYRALQGIRKELPFWAGTQGTDLANVRLRALADAMPGIRTFLIMDANGTVIACNREQVIGQSVSQRDYFQVPLKSQSKSTLFISPPFKTILGNFVINVALMVPGPQGKFAGVVSAALDAEYFTILLGSVLYAPDMWADLAHGDGKLFLRVPERGGGVAGLDLSTSGSLFTRHLKSGRQTTVFTGSVPLAGAERLMVQRTVRPDIVPMDKPLVVAVSRDMSALYADWRREAFGKGALFGVLVLAMMSALYIYQRRQREFDAISARHLEELLQATEAAVTANGAKSRFLMTVAHEFRTPLSLLSSSTDILDRYGERLSKEESVQQHDHIRNAARQMSGLVDSVLAFNRMEARNIPNNPAMLDVWRFCHGLVDEIRASCSRGHIFHAVIAEECGTVLLDEVLFRRVVENLLTNAFRYTPDGGTVSLQVMRENNRLRVIVADSGIGIPEEDQKRVFEAFYRCRNVEAHRGLGLGLAIVHESLVHMGGMITINSSIGAGTTMSVEIPLVNPSGSEE